MIATIRRRAMRAAPRNSAEMVSQVSITHFEIYVLVKKRWTLQVRFRQDQKDEALQEARAIEQSLNVAVKVLRETYYPATNTCEEVVVYISPRIAAPEPPVAVRGVEAAARGRPAARRGAARRRSRLRTLDGESTTTLLAMLLVIVVISLGIAATVTEAVQAVLDAGIKAGHIAAAGALPRLAFGTFATTFLAVAIPLTLWFLAGAEKRVKARAKRAAHVRNIDLAPESPAQTALNRAARGLLLDLVLGVFRPAVASGPDRQTEEPAKAQAPAEPPPASEPAPEPTAAEPEQAPQPEPEPDPAPAPAQPEPAPGLEKHRLTAMRFLGEAVTELKRSCPQLDAYSRFGVNLVMAGAIETLARQSSIPDDGSRELLREAVEMLGTRAELAEAFCDKLDGYMLEPRYLQMVQSGGALMERHLAGERNALSPLAEAIDGWNKPGGKQAGQRIVTVMFTDMVGSTDLTQAQGDLAAQALVRRHNSIVRTALAEFDGREVKHTGDGIMASFASTANAVDAAVAIQRSVAAYNTAAPHLPVHLRIGINAGEPIAEEDDLFGTMVQLAARICAGAQPDQILCSNVVRELSAGKGRRFAPMGEHQLKGFKEPVPLYQVLWEEAATAEEAVAAPAS